MTASPAVQAGPLGRPGAGADRRLLARGELPVGRPDLPAGQPAAARAAAARARQAAAARATGARRPGLNFVYAHLNRAIARARPRRDLRHRPGPRRPRPGRQHLPRGHLQRGLPRHRPGRGGHAAAVPAVLLPGRHPEPRRAGDARARSTRAASSATRSCTPTAPRSTTPTCWCAASSATARRRPGPLAASWHSNKFLDPRRDGAVLPILHLNGYKIANPTVLARIPRDELRALLRGLRPHAVLRRGRRARRRCTSRWPRRWTRSLDEIARDPAPARARTATPSGPRWPMIVLRTPKGWTGPKEVDGKPVEGTCRSHQVPLAGLADEPRAPRASSRSGCAATGPRSCSTRTARRVPELAGAAPGRRAAHGRQPARQRRRCCCATSSCPTSATTPSTCRRPARRPREATRVLGDVPARRHARATDDRFRLFGPGRDRVQPARARVFEATDRAWDGRASCRRRRPPRAATAG